MDSVQNSTQSCPRGYLFTVLIFMLSKESCCHSCVICFCTPVSVIPATFLQCFYFEISPSVLVLDQFYRNFDFPLLLFAFLSLHLWLCTLKFEWASDVFM
jgi:hypothetical protein